MRSWVVNEKRKAKLKLPINKLVLGLLENHQNKPWFEVCLLFVS
jgi:hypothetical protein